MKKTITIALATIFLASCSSEESVNRETTAKQITGDQGEKRDFEKEYIKTAIETSLVLNESVDKLEILLNDMDVTNPTWSVEVNQIALKIQIECNSYTLASDFLEENLEKKYEKTMKLYGEGVNEFHSIYSDITDAMEIYDKRKLEEIKLRLNPAIDLINKGTEQLEVERYTED
ncbi:hypothetical protein [Mesobacillus stamsii]|uniref:Lipoprotein n=1 Tax=Mesobacillus stamsii TaxID=225347 RepID=A0ABU0FSN7_9BACI|nr:hypothetical protein [Mesobacillus stamsii]MDQ0412750.1 hypothetical protein [Mesobacillus stamsii]